MRAPWIGAVALLLAGCERDPSFFGIWDLERMEVDGEGQDDAGVFEIDDDSTLSLLLRYQWSGGFVPDPEPALIVSPTSASENGDIFDNYKKKGEVYVLTVDAFDATFAVDEYTGTEAVLSAEPARYPRPALETPDATAHAITLFLTR